MRIVVGSLWLVWCLGGVASGGEALLADAVERLDGVAAEKLIGERAGVNLAQADGMTALHWAAFHDDLEMAKRLIAAGADAKAANRYGVTPLSLACASGDGALVELLLVAGASHSAAISGGETPLHTAARTGKVAAVEALLVHGAEVNVKERNGQTPLMWAAAEGHAEVVSALLSAKADWQTPLSSGFTPLLFAAREGRPRVVQILLSAGADLEAVTRPKTKAGKRGNGGGVSALVLAIENGHFELAVALLEAGADPNDLRSGFAPLHIMTWVRKPNRGEGDDGDPPPLITGTMTSLDFVRQLVLHGADVNLRVEKSSSGKGHLNRTGATPLLLAAFTGDVTLVKLLVELGADPRLANADGCTPLMAAAGVGTRFPGEEAGTEPEALETLEYLLGQGLDVNAVDKNGDTAMHGAAYKSLPLVVRWLTEHGAKINVWNQKNKLGWTPVLIAEGHRVGNFKPHAETLAALHGVLLAAGITPPPPTPRVERKGYE